MGLEEDRREEGLVLLELMAERSLLPTALGRSQKLGETSWHLVPASRWSVISWGGRMPPPLH